MVTCLCMNEHFHSQTGFLFTLAFRLVSSSHSDWFPVHICIQHGFLSHSHLDWFPVQFSLQNRISSNNCDIFFTPNIICFDYVDCVIIQLSFFKQRNLWCMQIKRELIHPPACCEMFKIDEIKQIIYVYSCFLTLWYIIALRTRQ